MTWFERLLIVLALAGLMVIVLVILLAYPVAH